jgi:ketosteroid isomerase-like protein
MAAMAASATAPAVASSVDDVQVRVYGNTAVAIVNTTWRGTTNGKAFADSFVATHVWVKSAPGWRLAGAQVTPIAAAK